MPEVNLKAIDGNNTVVNLAAWDNGNGRLRNIVYEEIVQARIGNLSDSIPATDSSNGSVIAFLKRIAQNITDARNDDFIITNTGTVSVGTTLTEIVSLDTRRYRILGFEIQNTAATAFNAFQIQGRFTSNASSTWFTIASVATDFTSSSRDQSGNMSRPIIRASGSLVTLAGNTNGWALVDVGGFADVRIRASVASGTTNAVIRCETSRY